MTPKKLPNDTLRKLALISEAGNALHSILNLDELLEKILSIVQKVFCLDNCAILILDRKTNELFIWKERGYNPKVVKTFRAKPGVGVTGWVVETGQPTLIENVRKDSRYIPGVKGANSEMAVPLRIGETVIGVLDAESKKSGCFTDEDLTMFAIFASQAATAIQHVKLLSELSNKIEDLERKTVGLQLGQNLSHVIAQARNYRNLIEELIQLFYLEMVFATCGIFKFKDHHTLELIFHNGYPKRKTIFPLSDKDDFMMTTLRAQHPRIRKLTPTMTHFDGTKEKGWEVVAPLIAMGKTIGLLNIRLSDNTSEKEYFSVVEMLSGPLALCVSQMTP